MKGKFYIFGILSAIFSIWIISFSIYNFPSADDFYYGANNSVNALSLSLNDYFHGSSGRIFSNTLYYYFASISNNNLTLYKIIPIVVFCFFVLVCFLLLNNILISYSKKDVLFITLIFIFIWLISMNSVNDTLFWYGGIFNYFLPMSLMFFSIYLFLKAYTSSRRVYSIILIFFSSIILFISSFSNEALFLVFFLIYLLIFIYNLYYNNKKLLITFLPLIIVLCLAFIFILISPGSSNRAEGSSNILFGLYRGLMTALERGITYYFTTAVIPVSLFLYIVFYKDKIFKLFSNIDYKYNGLILIGLGIILSWTAHFVVSYGLGALGLPPRAKVIPQTFSIITFIIGNIYLLYHFKIYDKYLANKRKYITFMALYMFFSFFNSDDFIGSFISIGEHKPYYEQNIERFEYLKNIDKNSKEIILKKIEFAPYPIAPIDARLIHSDCKYYVNTQLAYYLNYDGCIRLENGLDGDNSLIKRYFRKKKYFFQDGIRIWFYSFFK